MVSLATQNLNSDQKLVIIGGDSVALGRGQGPDLWTEKLQRKLGPAFKVINLAQTGMPVLTGPFIVFLALSEKYPTACYVGIGADLYVNDLEIPFHGYPHWWDAYYKGLLPNLPQIEASINQRFQESGISQREATDELKLGTFLDSIFYFRDLWTTVGYKWLFTVWTPPTSATFLKPRIQYQDIDPKPYPLETRFAGLNLRSEHDLITNFFGAYSTRNSINHKLKLSRRFLLFFEESARRNVPENVRSRVLTVRVRENPVVLNRALSKDEIHLLDEASQANIQVWKKIGVHTLYVGKDYQAADYLDGCHLSGTGGAKLADAVASEIMELK